MSEVATPEKVDSSPAPAGLEQGTYELLRQRLAEAGRELRERLGQLDESRRAVFGSIPTELLSTQRVTTENNCVPQDIVAVGKKFVFGYNVRMGLRSETNLSDVFSVYEFDGQAFVAQSLDLLGDKRFNEDFKQLYKYYKATTFSKFHVIGPTLHMVFQVGKTAEDVKSFKFVVQGEQLIYVDNRSDHEVRFPPQYEFEWKRTTRELHRSGKHPHISIEDLVFVETVGGDLTIKIEDNTEEGSGIYSEPVDDRDQTLDDAEIHYAIVGQLVLLKIKPYKERAYRYLVYNRKIQKAQRIDSLANSAVLLPEDHGLIFSNGYYLQTGDFKTFESGISNLLFEKRIASPNGEDHLFVFHNREGGDYVLLSYNMIRQQVETPLVNHGFSLFDDGKLLSFRADVEPKKHHAVQVWQTPYVGPDFPMSGDPDSFLDRIGNKDIVRAMAEAYEVLNLLDKDDSYANLYLDLSRKTTDLVDTYFWLDDSHASSVGKPIRRIREVASSAIEEFDKVVRVRRNTQERFSTAEKGTREAISSAASRMYRSIDDFVTSLSTLRRSRGDVISLRELKYVDRASVDALEKEVEENADRISRRCVDFLLREDSLDPYKVRVKEHEGKIASLPTVAVAKTLSEQLETLAGELEMLIDVVSNLKIDDATQRTRIVDSISSIYSQLNQTRATLRKKTSELRTGEGAAEFHAQIKLVSQATSNYLDIADSPQKCDEYLTKMMVQVEELEGRFAEFDEFVVQLTEKREEIYAAFDARRIALVEARNRRATALQQAADRILKGIASRVKTFSEVNDIHAYFASDLMIEKVRDLCRQLSELEESVKVDEIQGRLKSTREDAVRQLRDRQELFEGGENVIKLGKHRFSVNTQPLELTTVLKEESLWWHLTGTAFQELVCEPTLQQAKDLWQQEIVSENVRVYRGEYLTWLIYRNRDSFDWGGKTYLDLDEAERTAVVQKFMAPRYTEGYVKGVHDHDAAKILAELLSIDRQIGNLRYSSRSRVVAHLFWSGGLAEEGRRKWLARIQGIGAARSLFPKLSSFKSQIEELAAAIEPFVSANGLGDSFVAQQAAGFLFDQLAHSNLLAVHVHAATLTKSFASHLERRNQVSAFRRSLEAFEDDRLGQYQMAVQWLEGFMTELGHEGERAWLEEAAVVLISQGELPHLHAETTIEITGLLGSHSTLGQGPYRLDYHEFVARLTRFENVEVPRYIEFVELKKKLLDEKRQEMRLDEFKPRVLTSFVRNKLIDEVYLPLIGDNLAKQMGAVGDKKRTDLMGLLLLISPPGYGKTTLMEYVANRLGLTFMKINGPAVGHQVTSLDPAEAPNASAREEIEKLNLSLEMGDNVMIYLDDIQHCNPELLQKFISLCDGSRRIEGVYRGKPKTYDLRGRKVCVVMAGNPYTESGSKFQIPDMLANRADTYNLGDVVGENGPVFEQSYLENALSSNSSLQTLQSRSRNDLDTFIKMAQGRSAEGLTLEANYTADEIQEIVAVLTKLLKVRDVLLRVNAQYIASAAQADEYRVEPPFKMQGSYRDMNKIAEKVVALMNDQELDVAIMSHFENQAQTLTTGAEANLLKFKSMQGWLSEEESERWEEIKRTFQRNVLLGGVGSDDRVGQVIAQLTVLGEGLVSIRKAVETAAKSAIRSESSSKDQTLLDPRQQLAHHVAGGVQLLGDLTTRLSGISDEIKQWREFAEKQPAVNFPPINFPSAATAIPAAPSIPAVTDQAASGNGSAQESKGGNVVPEPLAQGTPVFDPGVASFDALGSVSDSSVSDEVVELNEDEVEVVDLESGTSKNRKRPAGAAVASGTTKIEVINKVPRQFLDIIKAQFLVLQNWFEPLMKATEMRGIEAEQLRAALKTSLERYEELLKKIGGR